MSVRVGISGMGRIGRLTLRAMLTDPEVEVVAVNNPSGVEMLAHLMRHDSVHGFGPVVDEKTEESITLCGQRIQVLGDRNPANLPWGELGVDVVVESTGKFNDGTKACAHIEAGAKKVLITAPAKNVDATIVMGVNEGTYDPETMHIVSNASCTTNCLAPMAKVLHDNFGIVRGFINTVHAYTNDQKLLDTEHKDLRRARAANFSVIPTSTGAARAVALVMPELAGKLDGFATRVPTPDGSMVDLTVQLERPVTRDQIDAAMRAAAEGPMKGILEFTDDDVVSVDIVDNPHSSIFDSKLTMILGDECDLVKCISWYDNEWGYSNRVKDLAKIL